MPLFTLNEPFFPALKNIRFSEATTEKIENAQGRKLMSDVDFKFERFEEYFGTTEEVKRTMDECKVCGAKLLLSHMPDYKNLLVQETARCMDCGCGNRKVIHILN
jgi:hypothetical protein